MHAHPIRSLIQMMTLLSLSVFYTLCMLPGAVIGIIRFPVITTPDRPLVLMFCLGFLNEFTSLLFIFFRCPTAVNGNIYVLLEYFLALRVFYSWGLHQSRLMGYFILGAACSCVWIIDNLILHSLTTFNICFRIVSAMIIVCLSTDQINQLVYTEKGKLSYNTRFLAASGFLVFFFYKLFYEILYFIELPLSYPAHQNLYFIFLGFNLMYTLLYTLVIIWLPTKLKYYISY